MENENLPKEPELVEEDPFDSPERQEYILKQKSEQERYELWKKESKMIEEQTKKEWEEFVVELKAAQEPFLKQYVDKEEALKFWHIISSKYNVYPEVDVEFDIAETTVTRDRYWVFLMNPEDINGILNDLIEANFINEESKKLAVDFFKNLENEPYYQICVGIDYDTDSRIRFGKAVPGKFQYQTLIVNNNKKEKEEVFTKTTELYRAITAFSEAFSICKIDLHLAPFALGITKDGELEKIKFVCAGDPIQCPGSNDLAASLEMEKGKVTFFVTNPNNPIFKPTHNLDKAAPFIEKIDFEK